MYLSCANYRMALLGTLEVPVAELWWNIMCILVDMADLN